MKAFKLTLQHAQDIRYLFDVPKYMSQDTNTKYFIDKEVYKFADYYHSNFCETYLSGLNNYSAWGIENNGHITAALAFYQSSDDASWYWNIIRTAGNCHADVKFLLDSVLDYNESRGYLKFYSMFPRKHRHVYRRFAFSNTAAERYDYFDEYYVQDKHCCKFTLAWQILYARTLLPVDTIVRCTFLKQKYRTIDYCAGRL